MSMQTMFQDLNASDLDLYSALDIPLHTPPGQPEPYLDRETHYAGQHPSTETQVALYILKYTQPGLSYTFDNLMYLKKALAHAFIRGWLKVTCEDIYLPNLWYLPRTVDEAISALEYVNLYNLLIIPGEYLNPAKVAFDQWLANVTKGIKDVSEEENAA